MQPLRHTLHRLLTAVLTCGSMAMRWGIDRRTAGAALLNVLSYGAATVAGEYDLGRWLFWGLLALGVVATLLLLLITAQLNLEASQVAATASEAQRSLLQAALVPITEQLGAMVAAPPGAAREAIRGSMTHSTITAASLLGPDKSRVCFLEVQGAPGSRSLKCPPGMWIGRHQAPQTTFVEGQPRGDRLLDHMDNRKPLFVRDVSADPPQFQSDPNLYKTFIVVTVAPYTQYTAYGVLTMDAVNPGDLKEEDIKILEVLGQLLGAALAM